MIACPSDAELRAFHDGSLADPGLDAVAAHLSGCPACEAVISRIESGPVADPLHAGFRALRSVMLNDTPWDPALAPVNTPTRCGRYELRDRLGVGGMGVVYRAWDPELKRFAAVKVLRAGGAARPDELTRFHREAELLARLRHPNLVEVYEAGASDGQPYLAMELVEGGSLADRLERGPLAPRAAAGLVRDVARAVRVAHLCGITHRDIKPANVLLGKDEGGRTRDETGPSFVLPPSSLRPKLSDFGLARLDDPASRLTHTGVAAGTPAYMAPEQADPRVGAVGPPADVWALGAVLYECLAGRPPFTGETPAELFRKLLEQDPPPLAGVPHDLAVICLKCLRKVPADRYPTAGELADDLDRFLAGEPVRARPVGTAEAAWKWAKRRPWVAGLAAGLVGVTALGAAATALALVHALAGWDAADRRERDAVAARDRAERQLYFSRVAQAELRWRANDVRAAAGLLAACPPERRGWEWEYLDGLLRSAVARADADTAPDTWHPVGGSVNDLAFTSDGGRLFTLGGGNPFQPKAAESGPASAVGWDPTTGTPVGPPLRAAAHSRTLVVRPDGRAAAALERTGTVRQWATADGRKLSAVAGVPDLGRLYYRPDGGLRLVGFRNVEQPDRRVMLEGWDAVAGRRLWAHEVPKAVAPAWAAAMGLGGGRVAAAVIGVNGGATRVVVLDADSGAAVTEVVTPAVASAVALSADGGRLAVHADALRVFEAAGGRPLWSAPLPAPAGALAFGPDGRHLAAGLADRTVLVWAAETGARHGTWRGHAGRVSALAFHPDGRRLAVGTEQPGEWSVWDLTRPQECTVAFVGAHARSAEGIGFAAGGRDLMVVVPARPVQVLDPASGAARDGPPVPVSTRGTSPATLAVFAADGSVLVGKGADPSAVTVWDPATGAERATFTVAGADVWRVAASADGTRVAASAGRWLSAGPPRIVREVRVWDVATGRAVFELSVPVGFLYGGLALAADGSRVAFTDTPDDAVPPGGVRAGRSVRVRLWDLTAGREEWSVVSPDPILGLAFDGPGRRLAGGGWEGRVRVWDAATGRPLAEMPPGAGERALAFSPDGARLAGADRDRVRLWNPETGDEVLDLGGVPYRPGDDGYNPQLVWTADGRRLAAVRGRGYVAVWDAGPRR